jgi:hypothetical protein
VRLVLEKTLKIKSPDQQQNQRKSIVQANRKPMKINKQNQQSKSAENTTVSQQ